MDTAFQLRRDIVSGHVPSTLVILNEGSSSSNSILRGAAVIEKAISTPGRLFRATAALDTSPLFGGGVYAECMTIVESKEIDLFGFVALNRLTDTGADR
jgi:hypothetical protein